MATNHLPLKLTKKALDIMFDRNKCSIMTFRWVYLRTTDNPFIYKIGRTAQKDPDNRSTIYNSTCVQARTTYNEIECENALKKVFRQKFTLWEGSTEYFVGCIDDIIYVFNSVVSEFNESYDISSRNLFMNCISSVNTADPPNFNAIDYIKTFSKGLSNKEKSIDKTVPATSITINEVPNEIDIDSKKTILNEVVKTVSATSVTISEAPNETATDSKKNIEHAQCKKIFIKDVQCTSCPKKFTTRTSMYRHRKYACSNLF